MIRRSDLLWAFFVLAGLGALMNHQAASGRPADPPGRWPSGLERGSNFTLLLFAHPHCPCTRATLRQLERRLQPLKAQLKTFVVFVKPPDTEQDFHLDELWELSQSMSGVTTLCDDDGRWARAFGCYTSGQALLYGPDGGLRFAGGLTASRGHEGDSIGLEAVETLGRAATVTEVYGCPLSTQGDTFCRP